MCGEVKLLENRLPLCLVLMRTQDKLRRLKVPFMQPDLLIQVPSNDPS